MNPVFILQKFASLENLYTETLNIMKSVGKKKKMKYSDWTVIHDFRKLV